MIHSVHALVLPNVNVRYYCVLLLSTRCSMYIVYYFWFGPIKQRMCVSLPQSRQYYHTRLDLGLEWTWYPPFISFFCCRSSKFLLLKLIHQSITMVRFKVYHLHLYLITMCSLCAEVEVMGKAIITFSLR